MTQLRRHPDLTAILLLILTTSMFVGFRWYYDNFLIGFDMFGYFLPNYEYLGQRLRDFDVPAWTPHQNGGYPFAGDPGAAWMYFPAMIGMFLATGGGGIKIMILIQALVAAVSTFGFCRRLHLRTQVAFFAGLAYAVGPSLTTATGQSTVIGQISTFVPLGFLALESAWQSNRTSSRVAWSSLAGIAACQMFLAWPQGFMYGVMMMAGWLAYRTLIDRDPRERSLNIRLKQTLQISVVAGASAAMIGAAGILPRLDFSRESNIPNGDYSNAIGGDYVEWYHTWTEVLSNFLTSNVYWRIMLESAVLLLLAAFAVCVARRRFGMPFFALMTLLAVDLSVDPSLTRWAFYLFPPFQHIHEHRPTGTMYMAFFPLIVLAASGTQLIIDGGNLRWMTLRIGLPAVFTFSLLAIVEYLGDGVDGIQVSVAVLAIVLISLAATRWPSKLHLSRQTFVVCSLMVLVLAYPSASDIIGTVRQPSNYPGYGDLFGKDVETQSVIAAMEKTSEPGTAVEYLQTMQESQGPFRYAYYFGTGYMGDYVTATGRSNLPGVVGGLANGRAVFLGLQEISGYNPIHLKVYVEYTAAMNGQSQNYHWLETFEYAFTSSPLLDMLNVRYVLIDASIPPDRSDVAAITANFIEVYRDNRVIVYENPDAFARAWVVHDLDSVPEQDVLPLLTSAAVDGTATAIISGELPLVSIGDGSVADSAIVTLDSPEHLTIDVTSNGDGLLVLSEVYEHNWKAWVDGEEVDILRTNHAFRGIPVPSGSSQVVLKYEPRALQIGLWSTAGGSLALIGIWTWATVDRRRHREREATKATSTQ